MEATIEFCRSLREGLLANLSRALHARLLAARGDRTAAIALIDAHLAEAEAVGYPPLLAEMRSLLAELLLAEGRLDEARDSAARAIVEAENLPTLAPLVSARRTLYEVAARQGDAAIALEHFRRYAEADKAYLDDVKARELAYQMVRHETAQKTQTIALLNKQNEVLQLEQQVASAAAANTRLLAALLAVLAASIGYWAYKIKRLQLGFRRLAETDALTGVGNRHHFTRQAEAALAERASSGAPVALVMLDLDHFKSINDQHGHAIGDWVLRAVAEACRPLCRREDLFGRLGGEEFALLLPDCDASAAANIAEQCRAAIAAIDTATSGHRFSVSASLGVADTAGAGYELHALMLQADQAMYCAKREGRDRVRIYSEPD
jgi:diguanylate cyclase (GGDEF)-like protein